ncbi:glycosyltransferase family 2 protein [Pseudarthrobacter sp. WHRI 8279]|uniref:glycosyltransferase family 2 protein n=1 Tax=Pseudarthrobacter sp. WHRI 8279 TaxID=3162566 RepID=UPI0035A99957
MVSLCIPTYNPDIVYLQELLESIERQTWPNIEVLISDDNSSNFDDFAATLQNTRFRRTVVRANRRLGMAQNWNEAARSAQGDYLLVVGQDDLLQETGVATLVEAAAHSGAGLVFGGQGHIGPEGQRVSNPSRSLTRNSVLPEKGMELSSAAVIALGLSFGNILGDPCSTLIRRDAFEDATGFSPDFRHAADLELWLRLASAGVTAVSLSTEVAFHRSHKANATATHVSSGIAEIDRLGLHERYGAWISDDKLWNRSVLRLYLHAAYDVIRYRIRPTAGYPRMRGGTHACLEAWLREVAEQLRLTRPDLSTLV